MIYYPLTTLMLAGIQHTLVLTTPLYGPLFERLVGDGSDLVGKDKVALVLGENISHSHDLPEMLAGASARKTGATVFGYVVNTPEQYGVVELDAASRAISIEEKPLTPKSNVAVGAARLHRQSRLGAVKRLNLALFVDREDDRMGGRIDVKADDVLEFFGELRNDVRPPHVFLRRAAIRHDRLKAMTVRSADVHDNSCSHANRLNCFAGFGNPPNESDY